MKNQNKIIVLGFLAALAIVSFSLYGSGFVFGQNEGPQPANSRPVFIRLSNEYTDNIRNEILADQRIQDIIEGQEYEFTIQGQLIKETLWHLDVGGVLQDNVDADEVKQWREAGRPVGEIVSNIVGVLYVGNNATYYLYIDGVSGSLTDIEASIVTDRATPELTTEERQRAVEIALEDQRIQDILKDKQYTIAPDGVKVWHIDREKIGAGFEIRLDQPYEIEYAWPWPEIDKVAIPDSPYYDVKTYPGTFETRTIVVLVDLLRQEVAGIQRGPVVD